MEQKALMTFFLHELDPDKIIVIPQNFNIKFFIYVHLLFSKLFI